MIKLYHGTNVEAAKKILKEGLKGGNNRSGGNRGSWDHPILFLAKYPIIAQKYGAVLEVTLTQEEFEDLEQINDGLGDRCYLIHGIEWDEILISADKINIYLTEREKEEEAHEDGICFDNCSICAEEKGEW